jgi:hypothetical protein
MTTWKPIPKPAPEPMTETTEPLQPGGTTVDGKPVTPVEE